MLVLARQRDQSIVIQAPDGTPIVVIDRQEVAASKAKGPLVVRHGVDLTGGGK